MVSFLPWSYGILRTWRISGNSGPGDEIKSKYFTFLLYAFFSFFFTFSGARNKNGNLQNIHAFYMLNHDICCMDYTRLRKRKGEGGGERVWGGGRPVTRILHGGRGGGGAYATNAFFTGPRIVHDEKLTCGPSRCNVSKVLNYIKPVCMFSFPRQTTNQFLRILIGFCQRELPQILTQSTYNLFGITRLWQNGFQDFITTKKSKRSFIIR